MRYSFLQMDAALKLKIQIQGAMRNVRQSIPILSEQQTMIAAI